MLLVSGYLHILYQLQLVVLQAAGLLLGLTG